MGPASTQKTRLWGRTQKTVCPALRVIFMQAGTWEPLLWLEFMIGLLREVSPGLSHECLGACCLCCFHATKTEVSCCNRWPADSCLQPQGKVGITRGLVPNQLRKKADNITATYIIRCVSDEKSTYLPKINLRS